MLKCLEVNEGETVLDVGCGYGPLGLSLAKAYGAQVTMVDINNALDLARQNAERNKVEATIFQLTSMNMLKESLTMLFPIRRFERASKLFMRLSKRAEIS